MQDQSSQIPEPHLHQVEILETMTSLISSMTTGVDNLVVALEYARQWPVLPLAWITHEGLCGCRLGAACNRPGKHPLTTNGVKDATIVPEAIKGLWEGRHQANVGICTGPESGLLVLDVDPRNGGDKSLARLEFHYAKLPKTLVCSTGGGGVHFYLQHPGITPLKGHVPGYAGLDIKGDGGYVVAPPSLHHSGGVYQWLTDWRTTGIAPVPEWLLELIRVEENQQPAERNVSREKRQTAEPAWMTTELSPCDLDILQRIEMGMEGCKYQALAQGAWEGLDYHSQSEADQALFNKLSRLTHGDPGRMYVIFKETALMRHDEKHFGYYQLTIQKAIDGMDWEPEPLVKRNRGGQMVIPGRDRGHGEQDIVQTVSAGLGCADCGAENSVGSATSSREPTGVAADDLTVSRLTVVNEQPPPPHPCGPLLKCHKGKEDAEVTAGGEPAEDLGLGTTSSFIKKGFLYEEGNRDPKRDTFPDAAMEGIPPALDGQHHETSSNFTLSAEILAYAEGRSQGFTLSQLWESGHFRDTKRDTLKKALQRMPGDKLAKIGEGKRALFCKPEYEETARAACQAAQITQAAVGKAATCNVTNPHLPRVEDLLMKKPQVLPQPLPLKWALGLERLIRVSTGNVVIIGGSTDAGKTILLLDFIMRNMDAHSIRCINWEMDEGELYTRLRLLEKYYGIPVDSFYDKVEFVDWYCDALDPKSMEGLIHLIDSDKVNIVDYLTANSDFYGIGGVLERIHNKLRKGAAVVALQKDRGAELPYGKGHTQKVSRVALTLDPAPDRGPDCTHLRFTKAKGRVNRYIKPTRVDIFFDILDGAKLVMKEAKYLGKAFSSLDELISGVGKPQVSEN
jgi:hypothetical protein